MKYNKNLAFLIFAVLIGISIFYSFYFTPLTISDTDPSTYVVISIIMLPIFAFLFIKNDIKIDVKKRDIIYGVFFFLIAVFLTIILNFYFSYSFLSYRVDLIIFPFMIFSIFSLLFGIKNLKKIIPIVIYVILSSSLIMLFLILQNQTFTIINTKIVYSIVSIFFKNATYLPPITILANNYHIGIGESCVGLGILLAIMFLIAPIAYFYNGSLKKKILWFIFGVVIVLLLNIFRMSLIALIWIFYGPTQALSIFHSFAGIFIFYISIILILILSSKLPDDLDNKGEIYTP